MTPRARFLAAVLGARGAAALAPVVKAEPALEAFLLPRAAVAWLGTVTEHDGTIPGTATRLVLRKTARGLSGVVDLGQPYAFVDAPVHHVTAALTVALGAAPGRPDLRDVELARLGKTVDALVKAGGKARGAEHGTGVHAKPIAPEPPAAPTPTAPEAPGAKPRKKPKLPRPPKTTEVKLTRTEATALCLTCRTRHRLEGTAWRPCHCLAGLSKAEARVAGDAVVLVLGQDWDRDATITLLDVVGRR